MRKVITGRLDIFAYRATLKTSSWFASSVAQIRIGPSRTWYGALRGVVIPVPNGVLNVEAKLTDLIEAGGFEKYVHSLIRKAVSYPQAVRTRVVSKSK